LTVLTWNLMHGRAVPGAGRDLFEEFSAALSGWEWNVAALQEVPPWWPAALAARLRCEERHVLTSRNWLLELRRAVAVRWPDLVKSNGGGCNAILVRDHAVLDHRTELLALLPERRRLHAVALDPGVWVGNLHTGADASQGRRAAAALRSWAGDAAAVLAGDFNVAPLALEGFSLAGASGVDQVFVAGLGGEGEAILERGRLSDHAPLAVSVSREVPTA
jgi:endonuclease/exonuclease/phosphatase family metal-dependent hydrolase